MKNKHANQKPSKTNQVRIIGGSHKRRLISFIDADGLRPTPDRLRETLFNWLTGSLGEAKVLDACAGSGVLGLESLSRGAAFVHFIEYQKAQANLLQLNAQKLQLDHQVKVSQGDALDILKNTNQVFDLIFLDPPYTKNLWQAFIDCIFTHKLYHCDTLIYLEADQPLEQLLRAETLEQLTILKNAKVGQAHAYLLGITKQD